MLQIIKESLLGLFNWLMNYSSIPLYILIVLFFNLLFKNKSKSEHT